MVHLPTEILDTILREFIKYTRYPTLKKTYHLAPLATVNSQWCSAVESILWKRLMLTVSDINEFRRHFHESPSRRFLLEEIWLRVGYYIDVPRYRKVRLRNYDDLDSEDSDFAQSHSGDSITIGSTSCQQYGNGAADRKTSVMEKRIRALRRDNARLFGYLKIMWDEISEWGDDARLIEITFHMTETKIYHFLGRYFQPDAAAERLVAVEQWLSPPDFPQLPLLPTVKTFTLDESQCDLWSLLIGCKIANTLPSLEELALDSGDRERAWPHLFEQMREVISNLISTLPVSLRKVVLPVYFCGNNNHNIKPRNLLLRGVDTFSRAMNGLSTHLTTLAMSMNYITADIFAVPETGSQDYTAPLWPNLKILDIKTGFERADGRYWMRSLDDSTPKPMETEDDREPEDWDEDSEEHVRAIELGIWPVHCFLARPEPVLFDELSTNIARAVSHMPKLEYLNVEFTARNRGHYYRSRSEDERAYKGWAFYFRASNQAKFASKYFKGGPRFGYPGIDWTDIERPRTEWVFQCPYLQIQWEEPDEAKDMWRERFPTIDFELLTQDHDGGNIGEFWERRRAGKLIDSDWRPYSPYVLSDEEGDGEDDGDDEKHTDDEDNEEDVRNDGDSGI